MTAPRTLRVAGVQVESRNFDVEGNLRRAESLVAAAGDRGAELVLCPELLAAGYVYDAPLWNAGEPRGGPTESWLARMARRHGIYIGASYLEASGDDFFNTFTLMKPDGSPAGRVRKQSLPGFEAWFFHRGSGPVVFGTSAKSGPLVQWFELLRLHSSLNPALRPSWRGRLCPTPAPILPML